MYDIAVIGGRPGRPVRRHPGQGAQQVGTGGQRGRPGQSPLQDQPHRQLSGFLQCDRSRTAGALPHPRRTDGVERRDGRVLNLLAVGGAYYLSIGSEVEQARAVVLATGVVRAKKYPGEAERLGRGSELLRYLRRDALPGQGDRSGRQNRPTPPTRPTTCGSWGAGSPTSATGRRRACTPIFPS